MADFKISVYAGVSVPPPFIHQFYQLWNSQFPEQIKLESVKKTAETLRGEQANDTILVAQHDGQLLGWLALQKRDEDKLYIIMVIHPDHQKKGIGSTLLKKAQDNYDSLYGWVVTRASYKKTDGGKYESPLKFYEKFGFKKSKATRDENGLSTTEVSWQK